MVNQRGVKIKYFFQPKYHAAKSDKFLVDHAVRFFGMHMQETVFEVQADRGPPRMNLVQIKKLSTESKGIKFSIESPDWSR